MNSKKTISLLAMMAMCAAGSGHPVYDSQRGVKKKAQPVCEADTT